MAASGRGVERLRQSRDFVVVMRDGRRSRHRLVRLLSRSNGLPHNRYGFAVGRRVGKAVVRNRTRRRLREIMHLLPLAPGHDIVVTADPASVSASFQELARALENCASRSRLMLSEQRSE